MMARLILCPLLLLAQIGRVLPLEAGQFASLYMTYEAKQISSSDVKYEFQQSLYSIVENITVSPAEIRGLIMGSEQNLRMNYTCKSATPPGANIILVVTSDDTDIADVTENATTQLYCRGPGDVNMNQARVRGNFIGKTTLKITARNASAADREEVDIKPGYGVTVGRGNRQLTNIFIVTIVIVVMVMNVGFGCRLELAVVKQILKRPIAPALGFACQFLLLPMLAFGVSHMLGMSKALGIGLLVTATSPGGGASNVWTVVLEGDLNLSLTMTFISKIAALGTLPLWLFALGRFYIEDTTFKIPYEHIVTGLISLVIPVFFGLLIRRYKPKIAFKLSNLLKPFGLLFVLYIVIFGSIANLYVYRIMVKHWYVVPGIMLTIYGGYLFGFLVSLLCRQEKSRALTIGIETGIQDTGIAVILLQATFPIPEGDIAATIPMLTGLLQPWPLFFTYLGILCYRKRKTGQWTNPDRDPEQDPAVGQDKLTISTISVPSSPEKPGIEFSKY